ncbi:MAG: arsenic transporter [Gammaproteobacteria bacterium]|nr:arsenic transporter [Gammaproteobacteria bacterium]
MLTATLIFIVTLTLVIWRPKNLGIGWSALGGALAALISGVISLSDVPIVWDIVWDATFTLIALILISLVLDAAGFFEWAALHVARRGNGQGHWLFLLIVLLGAVVAALFANDGAVLILTPLVFEMLRALRFTPAATLAFIMATGFVSDTTSLPLMISNLVNIITANYFDISFADYATVMLPVNFVSLLATLLVLWLFFRKDVPLRFDVSMLSEPAKAIRDPFVFHTGWVVLPLVLTGYFFAYPLGLPVSAIAGSGALILLLAASREHFLAQQPRAVIPVLTLLREAPWQVVVFSLGMYLVVFGLRNQGLTSDLSRALEWLNGQGVWLATLGSGFLFASLSAIMNNLPAVLIGNLAIDDARLTSLVREAMIYANIIGCDLGPKMTPIGSLATLLWLHVLAQRGMKIGWGYYFRIGIVLTVPVLTITLSGLAGWLWLLRGN